MTPASPTEQPETPGFTPQECAKCLKPTNLCLCGEIRPLESRIQVLILQHPQEPDKLLGTARMAHLSLPNSKLRIGLSWPNLKSALGREADPGRWGVLYLGSGARLDAHGSGARPVKHPIIQFVTKSGVPLEEDKQNEILRTLEGIIVLDGTWSQAKTLWWRNAWLLKLRRIILNPVSKSLYGELRREPRGECLSTIETIAESLEALGEPAEVATALRSSFGKLLDAYRKNYSLKERPKRPRSARYRRRR